MERMAKLFFVAVLGVMLWLTVTASLERGVFVALGELWPNLWFRATLADAYFAFLTVYLWVAWRERSLPARVVWFVLFMGLGSMAISAYMLLALFGRSGCRPLMEPAGSEGRAG
jgi:hypothetical protein